MAKEDFTTYTEVDPNNHIELVGTDHIDHAGYRNEDAYLYKDMGAGHFTDFEHKVDVRSDFLQDYGCGFPWMLANAVDDYVGLKDANETCIGIRLIRYADDTRHLNLLELYEGNIAAPEMSPAPSANTWYYLLIKKTGTSLLMGIYSTANLRDAGDATDGDVDNLSLTLHANHSFRYIFAVNTWNDGQSGPINNDIEDLDLQEAAAVGRSFGYIIG